MDSINFPNLNSARGKPFNCGKSRCPFLVPEPLMGWLTIWAATPSHQLYPFHYYLVLMCTLPFTPLSLFFFSFFLMSPLPIVLVYIILWVMICAHRTLKCTVSHNLHHVINNLDICILKICLDKSFPLSYLPKIKIYNLLPL